MTERKEHCGNCGAVIWLNEEEAAMRVYKWTCARCQQEAKGRLSRLLYAVQEQDRRAGK